MKRSSLALVAFHYLALATTTLSAQANRKISRGSRAFRADETSMVEPRWQQTHRHGQRIPEDKYDLKYKKTSALRRKSLHVACCRLRSISRVSGSSIGPILAGQAQPVARDYKTKPT